MHRGYPGVEPSQPQDGLRPRLVALVAVVVIAGAVLAVLYPPIEATNTGIPVSRKVSQLTYPAAMVLEMPQPEGAQWRLPAGLAAIGEETFVVDTGNNRILKLDASGAVIATFDGTTVEGLHLQQPMALATDGKRLYVANSLAAQVLVLTPDGLLEQVITLETHPGDAQPRPIGLAALPGGGLAVSDADNHRVLLLDTSGREVRALGTGTRQGEKTGFNVPSALTLDASGNIYVVDTLNGRVVKLSPDGEFLQQFGSLADTAGHLARPKGVAVDPEGRVYVSDGLQAAIEVFGPDGSYLGVIGRRDPGSADAGSVFEAPAAISLDGNRLTVIDAYAGLISLIVNGSGAAAGTRE